MQRLFFLGLIIFSSCHTPTEKKPMFSRDSFSFSYLDKDSGYSIWLGEKDKLYFREVKASRENLLFTQLTSERRKSLDTLMYRLANNNKEDTVYFLPHLEIGGIYSINSLKAKFSDSFRYGENRPKIYYDIMRWIDEYKSKNAFIVFSDDNL